jgi:hypothetical protein
VRVGDGVTTVNTREREALIRACHWQGASFELTEERLDPIGATREPLASVVAAALRSLIRDLPQDDLLAVFADRMNRCPVFIPEREGRLRRLKLAAFEERTALRALDDVTDLAAHVASSPTTLRLLFVLAAFELVTWAPKRGRAVTDPRVELAARVDRMSTQNHFEALGVHWSVGSEDVAEAWKQFQAEFGPSGRWHGVDPALAAQALARGTAAWNVLSNETARLRYRIEAYPNVDQDMLIPLLEQRAQWLLFANRREEAEDVARLLREIIARPRPGAR